MNQNKRKRGNQLSLLFTKEITDCIKKIWSDTNFSSLDMLYSLQGVAVPKTTLESPNSSQIVARCAKKFENGWYHFERQLSNQYEHKQIPKYAVYKQQKLSLSHKSITICSSAYCSNRLPRDRIKMASDCNTSQGSGQVTEKYLNWLHPSQVSTRWAYKLRNLKS